MAHEFNPYEGFDLLTPVTFAIVGQSKDRQIVVPPGTGFFVAPYIALTAKHVIEALWTDLGMPWERHRHLKESKEADFFVKPLQLLDIRHSRREIVAVWEITGVTPCNHTDAAFLFLVPDNDVARNLQWPHGFPELDLLPPPVGAKLFAFGYPNSRIIDFKPGEARIDFQGEPTLVHGEATAVFDEGRGTWRFPQFHTTAPFEHGLSGAPVVHNGKICGIVSYGATYLEEGNDSYAAALWPLVLSEVEPHVDPRRRNTPVIDLVRSGQLRARNWENIRARARSDVTIHGDSIARLLPEE